MKNSETLNELEILVKEMKQITSEIERRKCNGLQNDGGLFIELANRKRRIENAIKNINYR
jgi:hypothetical protein